MELSDFNIAMLYDEGSIIAKRITFIIYLNFHDSFIDTLIDNKENEWMKKKTSFSMIDVPADFSCRLRIRFYPKYVGLHYESLQLRFMINNEIFKSCVRDKRYICSFALIYRIKLFIHIIILLNIFQRISQNVSMWAEATGLQIHLDPSYIDLGIIMMDSGIYQQNFNIINTG